MHFLDDEDSEDEDTKMIDPEGESFLDDLRRMTEEFLESIKTPGAEDELKLMPSDLRGKLNYNGPDGGFDWDYDELLKNHQTKSPSENLKKQQSPGNTTATKKKNKKKNTVDGQKFNKEKFVPSIKELQNLTLPDNIKKKFNTLERKEPKKKSSRSKKMASKELEMYKKCKKEMASMDRMFNSSFEDGNDDENDYAKGIMFNPDTNEFMFDKNQTSYDEKKEAIPTLTKEHSEPQFSEEDFYKKTEASFMEFMKEHGQSYWTKLLNSEEPDLDKN